MKLFFYISHAFLVVAEFFDRIDKKVRPRNPFSEKTRQKAILEQFYAEKLAEINEIE